jgi:hypothetical protein
MMKDSDEKLVSLRQTGERINNSVGMMVPDITYLTSAQYEMTKGNILTLIEEARAILKEVQQGYAGILNLDGVDEYIRYARVRLGLVHVDFQQLKVVEDFLDYITGELAGRDAGRPLDPQSITDATNATVAKMKELSTRVEELTTQAAQIKKDQAL